MGRWEQGWWPWGLQDNPAVAWGMPAAPWDYQLQSTAHLIPYCLESPETQPVADSILSPVWRVCACSVVKDLCPIYHVCPQNAPS